jgi:hypothetical protein
MQGHDYRQPMRRSSGGMLLIALCGRRGKSATRCQHHQATQMPVSLLQGQRRGAALASLPELAADDEVGSQCASGAIFTYPTYAKTVVSSARVQPNISTPMDGVHDGSIGTQRLLPCNQGATFTPTKPKTSMRRLMAGIPASSSLLRMTSKTTGAAWRLPVWRRIHFLDTCR